MHEQLIQQYQSLDMIKLGIIFLIMLVAVLLILMIFSMRSIFGDPGVQKSMGNISKLRARDNYIQKSTRLLNNLTRIIQQSPFAVSGTQKDYLQYNLVRSGVKAPGGMRNMAAEEFNAIVITITCSVCILCFVVALVVNLGIGLLLAVVTCCGASFLPLTYLRSMVKAKDQEIRDNFSDFYLMLHYVLITGAKTSLGKIMKTYQKTSNSEEMKRFVDICCGYIDTYGDQEATIHIARDYREVQEINKLMRLIKQLYDGSDITNELTGFRDELIKQKKYRIMRRMEVVITWAQRSFNLLSIILFQAILSAMAIYLPDMGGMSSFM